VNVGGVAFMAILSLAVGKSGFDRVGMAHAGVREGQVERNLKWLDGHERGLDDEATEDKWRR